MPHVDFLFFSLPIGRGGDADDFGEEAGEVVGVVDADFVADLVDEHVGVEEQPAGFLHLHAVEVGERGLACLGTEEEGEVADGVAAVA